MGMDRQIKKKKWPPRKIAGLASIVIFVAVVLYLFLFKLNKSTLNVQKERLTISTVTRGPFQEFIPIQGEVVPREQYFLTAEEGGRVDEIYMEAGTMVKIGDPILKLDNSNLHLTIMWREAELFQQSNNLRNTRLSMEQYQLTLSQEMANIENQLQQQKRTYERYQELIKDDLISQHEYELAKDQYEYLVHRKELVAESQKIEMAFRKAQVISLEESLERMQRNLAIARQKLENLTIRAKVSGHLTSLDAEIGQTKNPGDQIGQIDVLTGFKVKSQIDDLYLPRIEVGRQATFPFAGETHHMVVKKIYPEVRDQRFEIDLTFTGKEPEGIRRGLTLHIRLELGDVSEAILLPRGGFYQTTGGNWVYVVDESGGFAIKRSIKIRRQNPQVFEVESGLEPGEKVITSSYESFGDMDQLILK